MNTNTKHFSRCKVQQRSLRSNTLRGKQSGLTLIEIMIAITLSLFLMGGLIQIVIGNKQTYKVQDAMARVQENGRFSLHFLTKDIRMAGFMGCSNSRGGLTVTNNVEPADFGANAGAVDAAVGAYDGTSAILGYSYTGGALDAELTAMGLTAGGNEGDVMANSDILFIRRAASCPGGGVLSHNNNSASMQIQDNASCEIQQNDIVMVSNCQYADIFGVTNVVNAMGASAGDTISHGANLNIGPQLAGGYGPDSFIYRMKSEVYYIGVGASGEPALFKRDLRIGTLTSNELVEGIESLTLLYGEDRDDDGAADIYVDVGSVLDMEKVVSIRLTSEARTLQDNIATSVNADGDQRIRRNFTTTIGIRNRIS
jgi:type IV pilus assembly protein PilW